MLKKQARDTPLSVPRRDSITVVKRKKNSRRGLSLRDTGPRRDMSYISWKVGQTCRQFNPVLTPHGCRGDCVSDILCILDLERESTQINQSA